MATPRDIRRLAFQALYQLDALGEQEHETIRAGLSAQVEDDPAGFVPRECERAFDLALASYRARRESDALVIELAPTWPPQRQPAVDRAIVRLAVYEMMTEPAKCKVAVNEAVELAKRFSTERSPAFVNGVLDKVLKRVLSSRAAVPSEER